MRAGIARMPPTTATDGWTNSFVIEQPTHVLKNKTSTVDSTDAVPLTTSRPWRFERVSLMHASIDIEAMAFPRQEGWR